MSGWRIVPLPDSRIPEAWPLVRLRYPCWTLDTWLGEARTLLDDDEPSGILCAETGGGYIYALCAYAKRGCARGGDQMALPIVANVRWNLTDDPLERILSEVETIARSEGCGCIATAGGAIAAATDTARWEQLGYRWLGEVFRKKLPAAGQLPAARDPRCSICL
ncbi:MAG: hypothetical protein IPK81_01785 [Rhodospirillales bacterium]|nr:MAG: hypothetical protein IPK81_01785 [Rhodospirillales bacterium]